VKRILLFSIFFLLILAACERPAREVPEDVTEGETPTNTIEEAKPEEVLPGAEGAVDVTAEPGATGEGAGAETGAETGTETTGETDTGTGTETGTETDTTVVPGTEEEQPQNITYEIQAGDTLFAIGLLYGVSVDDIVRANGLGNADSLEVGQLIIIPVGGLPEDTTGTDTGGTDDGSGTTSGQEQVHIVTAGQTLFGIAQLYGLSVDELAAYNNITNPNVLEVGQQLKIPPQ
jgi:LysM repeat protein